MNAAQVDFQQLRIKHILYKSKVRSVLFGGSFDEAFFSPAGPVSTWFSSVGMIKYRQEVEMTELARVHQDLSSTASNLFQLYKFGKIDQAYDGLKVIEKKSEHFLHLLAQLEERLKDKF
ncbi:histidine kinase [Adhaeribacter arboris]|uniref:Histidine kinase n=1 Tax=Adhaeribacter arboris TaxID=2072846 RepID=A0A2T2YJL5_9BACT|nr:histidine kinase [Adhaeribacter arboris]PSR55697.1 histidine kinase [Adhaeribacter arboris]